jgi:hypothetical protein
VTLEGLIQGWLDRRDDGESFRQFCDRASDDELSLLAGREAAQWRGSREEAEAA